MTRQDIIEASNPHSSGSAVRANYISQGVELEQARIIKIIERLEDHGMTHSERCLPRHWFAEKAIQAIKGETPDA